MSSIDATLILPCYNESEHFVDSCRRIFAVLTRSKKVWEVIFIDDSSRDNTPSQIRKVLKKHIPLKMKAWYHRSNRGRGATVAEGIRRAAGSIVGYIDIDCEIDPRYIPIFVGKVEEGYDIVSAWRIYEFPWLSLPRYLASKLYILTTKLLVHSPFPDTEAGYKFFRRNKVLPILPGVSATHWFWDTEVLVRSQKKALKIAFIPTVFLRRHDKTSTVRLVPDTIEYLKSLWNLRKDLR